jgi:Flp pilus assembly protein protease CpaA
MDQNTGLSIIIVSALIGLAAIVAIVLRQRRDAARAGRESPFAASTEGEKLCPRCGGGNLAADDRCIYCGASLPDPRPPLL